MDETAGHPRIACIAGSRRFAKEFRAAWIRLALEGWTVVGTPDLDVEDGPEADAIVAAHMRLIGISHRLHVVTDESGYIGERTASEISAACEQGKDVTFDPGVRVADFARLFGDGAVSGK